VLSASLYQRFGSRGEGDFADRLPSAVPFAFGGHREKKATPEATGRRTVMANGPKVLVIDVGGTSVKLLATGQKEPHKFPSGPAMTAEAMVREAKKTTKDWNYDVVSIGYPGPVVHGRPLREPHNLAPGWVNFDFQRAFGRPVKIVNDAAMQALGSYKNGRMLFLGLGTGLGSTMIVDGFLEPMELAHLPYKKSKSYADYVGIRGLKRLGKKKWEKHVGKVVQQLREPLQAEEVLLGGGNVNKLKNLPAGTRVGNNESASAGGFRMWEGEPHARAAS
jgi:polyphosphate glucokinase